jgi:N-terminal acetyltransferase B complex non-catalytic subunit
LIRRLEGVHAEIAAHLDPNSGVDKSWRRNAHLALLKFQSEGLQKFPNSDNPMLIDKVLPENGQISNLVTSIWTYFGQYGNASTAFNDLRPFIEESNLVDRLTLLKTLPSIAIYENDEKAQTRHAVFPTDEEVCTFLETMASSEKIHVCHPIPCLNLFSESFNGRLLTIIPGSNC